MDKNSKEIIDFMIRLARKAGRIHMQHYGMAMERDYSLLRNLKLKVEEEVKTLIRREIEGKYPLFSFFSEEIPKQTIGKKKTIGWDELDGTNPYARQFNDFFSFSIVFCEDEIPKMSVVFCPKLKRMYVGSEEGAWCNGMPIHVSLEENLHYAWLATAAGKFNRTGYIPYLRRAQEEDGVAGVSDQGCASADLCQVADGRFDGFFATSLNDEDIAPAIPIAKGAGGEGTDLNGGQWRLGEPSILVTNRILHPKLVQFFRTI